MENRCVDIVDCEYRNALLEKAEELDWKVTKNDDGSIDFEKYSPAGEDFIFTVDGKNIAAEVRDYYEGFDPDDYAEIWVALKREPGAEHLGIPDIRTLIKDADDIDEMLAELSAALDKVEE